MFAYSDIAYIGERGSHTYPTYKIRIRALVYISTSRILVVLF